MALSLQRVSPVFPNLMNSYNLLNEPDDWSNSISRGVFTHWSRHGHFVLSLVAKCEERSRHTDYKITGSTILRELDLMPRKKGSYNGSTNGSPNANHSGTLRGNDVKWFNRRLTPEDLNELERADASLDFLLARIVELVDDGHGVSLKSTDRGASRSCTIIGSDLHNPGVSYGVSGFGGNLRDALLTAVYKYDVLLEGDITNVATSNSDLQQERRFG